MSPSAFRTWRSVAAAGAILAVAACADQPTAPPAAPPSQARVTAATLTPVPGRFIVLTEPGRPSAVAGLASAYPGQVEQTHREAGILLLRDLTATQLSSLSATPQVTRVVQDMSLLWIPPASDMRAAVMEASSGVAAQGTDQSGAQFYAFQWNIRQVQAPAAWNATPGGLGKMVCVLDTGVDPGHLDTNGKVDLGRSASMVASEPFIEDLNFHGTFVSALVSSRGIAMASVAPDAMLCAVKVLNVNGSGSFGDVINGILFAAGNGSDVINMSLGAYIDRSVPGSDVLTDALQRAINIATDRGVLVVTSSGNDGINLDEDGPQFAHIPSQLRNVISVGGTAPINQQNFDLLASYSNFGGRTGLHLVAPGGDLVAGGATPDLVLSACSRYSVFFNCGSGLSYLFGAGTSFASPVVAGAAAVVESQQGPLSPTALGACVIRSADPVGPARIFGNGRLNVMAASGC